MIILRPPVLPHAECIHEYVFSSSAYKALFNLRREQVHIAPGNCSSLRGQAFIYYCWPRPLLSSFSTTLMVQCREINVPNMWESFARVIQISNDKNKLTNLVGQCVSRYSVGNTILSIPFFLIFAKLLLLFYTINRHTLQRGTENTCVGANHRLCLCVGIDSEDGAMGLNTKCLFLKGIVILSTNTRFDLIWLALLILLDFNTMKTKPCMLFMRLT